MDVQRLAIINMGMCDSRVSWCQLAEGCIRVTGVPWVWYLHTSPPKSITSRLYWKPMGTLLIIIFVKCVWIICKERCMYTANYVLKHLKLKVGHPQVTRLKIGLARQELGDMYLPGWPVSIVYLTIGVCLHSESNANEEIVGTPAEEIKGRSEQQRENPVYRQRTNSWSIIWRSAKRCPGILHLGRQAASRLGLTKGGSRPTGWTTRWEGLWVSSTLFNRRTCC